MICEYCGNKWIRTKYSEGCKSCYGPKPERIVPAVTYDYAIQPEIKITETPARIMVGYGGGGGVHGGGGGGGAGVWVVTGGSGGSGGTGGAYAGNTAGS